MSKVADEKSEEKPSNEKEEFKGKPQPSVSKSKTRLQTFLKHSPLYSIRYGGFKKKSV